MREAGPGRRVELGHSVPGEMEEPDLAGGTSANVSCLLADSSCLDGNVSSCIFTNSSCLGDNLLCLVTNTSDPLSCSLTNNTSESEEDYFYKVGDTLSQADIEDNFFLKKNYLQN